MGFWDEFLFGGRSRRKVRRNPKRRDQKLKAGERTRRCGTCGGVGEVDTTKKGWVDGKYTDVTVREMCGTCHWRGVVRY